jgi:Sec-independent protein translocase protein TatA
MPPNRISTLLSGLCGLLASVAPVETRAQTPPATSPNSPPQGQPQPPQPAQASGDPSSSTAGSLFDTKLPALDASNGLLRFNGQTWDINNNAIFKARFEKFLSVPEETGEQEAAHRKILNEIIILLDPSNLKQQTLSDAYRLLARAAGFPGDTRLCDTLANAIYGVWQARRNQSQLAQANLILEEESARTRRNLSARAYSAADTIGSKTADAIVQAGRAESMVENSARIKGNDAKSALSELQSKVQYQGVLVQFFLQRRFHHVIIGTRFYRALFNDGDAKLNLPETSQSPFARGTGMPPTVTTLESLANEAIRDVQTNVQAFHKLYELGELRSASERLRDALLVGEFMPELRTLPFERKRKVLRFYQTAAQFQAALEARDYSAALELLNGPSGLQQTASDFDATKARALIDTARNAARLHLSRARNAAISGNKAAFEEAIKEASTIWPNNPELQEVAAKSFQLGDAQAQALLDLEQLLAQKNLRRIAEDAGRFLAAAQNATAEKQVQLKDVLQDVKLLEGTLMGAREMDRQGNAAGAWEAVDQVAERFPDDLPAQQARALYTTKAAEFVRSFRTAQDHEKRAQSATALAWYLKALRLYPKSERADEAARRLQLELITDRSP